MGQSSSKLPLRRIGQLSSKLSPQRRMGQQPSKFDQWKVGRSFIMVLKALSLMETNRINLKVLMKEVGVNIAWGPTIGQG